MSFFFFYVCVCDEAVDPDKCYGKYHRFVSLSEKNVTQTIFLHLNLRITTASFQEQTPTRICSLYISISECVFSDLCKGWVTKLEPFQQSYGCVGKHLFRKSVSHFM